MLTTARRSNFYGGVKGPGFVSGSGFVVSMDIVQSIVENQDTVWDPVLKYDDVCFGKFIFSRYPSSWVDIPRYDIVNEGQEPCTDDKWIQYRIRHFVNRETNDTAAREKLLKHFYGI